MYQITVSKPINGIGFNGREYLFGEDNKPLFFDSINVMLQYLADRNFTLAELLYFDFNIKEAASE